jgi:hypothetical protein
MHLSPSLSQKHTFLGMILRKICSSQEQDMLRGSNEGREADTQDMQRNGEERKGEIYTRS